MTEEIWKEITYKDYTFKISNKGTILHPSGVKTKGYKNQGGYKIFKIDKKHFFIHRLVMLTFGPPIELKIFNLMDVRHKGDKNDNSIENLRYTTHGGNLRENYTSAMDQNRFKIPVYKFALNSDTLLEKYESSADASRKTNIDSSAIRKCCKRKVDNAGGFSWAYKDPNPRKKVF